MIIITRATTAGGKRVDVGEKFEVGKTITEKDARTLLSLGKAEEYKEPVKKSQQSKRI